MTQITAERSGAVGSGLATIADDGTILDAWFPDPRLSQQVDSCGTVDLSDQALAELGGAVAIGPLQQDVRRKVSVRAVRTMIGSLSEPAVDAFDIYLRLHLLSHRLGRPRAINLTGMFSILTNVAWTSIGPCLPGEVDNIRWRMRAEGVALDVRSVDKIPRMTDYVVPPGVRIADANRVRLGAYLAPGTTVMHEGFCNFNAGTLGVSMVEGRISAGVIVGDGSDIGGGASIMGTLSGGGTETISVGERCLLGANSGIGISLGDDCVVEAGCYVTAGTRVSTPDGKIVKAAALSGRSSLMYRRNSQTGAVEALSRNRSWGALNPSLHNIG
jgi:2,3,4,5-tetrahydropyridine-2,6-dicarboxylate N-succinyltransferase